MNRRAEDEELDKLLDEELIWEAEMIEHGLLSDSEIEERHMSKAEIDASFDKLVEKLKAEGVYREDEKPREESSECTAAAISMEENGNSGKVIPMPERNADKDKGLKRRYGLGKVAGLGLVCILSVLGASMSIEGNREYFLKKIDYYTGNDTKIDVDNIEGDVSEGQDEQEAFDVIESFLGIKMPQFRYRPYSFVFSGFEVDTVKKCALVEYQYKDIVMALFVSKNDSMEKKGNYSIDGKEIDSVNSDHGEVQVKIMEVQAIDDEEPSYGAVWSKDAVLYQLSGKMEREEFIKLIEKMQF